MALGGILAVAAAAGTRCPTLQLTPTRAGFGNALQALYKAYDLAGHCGLRLELVESPLDREVVSGEVVSGRGRAGDRYRRICARLSCAGTTFVPAAAPADGQAATRWESKQCPGNPGPGGCAGAPCAVVGLPAPRKRRRCAATGVAPPLAEALSPVDGGAWFARLTCVGPRAAARAAAGAGVPFAAGAHIRSIRFNFERPPERVRTDVAPRGTVLAKGAPVSDDPAYSAAEWRSLAGRVLRAGLRGDVFVASDNAPARDELVSRVAERNGTACFVPRTPEHSSYHATDEQDDHALTDWWVLATATHTLTSAHLHCSGKTANTCQYSRAHKPRRGSSFVATAHRLFQRSKFV